VRIHTNGSGLALHGAPGLAKSPADSDNFRCGLRVKFRQRRDISTGEPGALLDPVVDQKRDSAGAARAVSLQRAFTVLAGEGLGAFQAAERWRWVDGNPADSVSSARP
jgi:hypothetical protein